MKSKNKIKKEDTSLEDRKSGELMEMAKHIFSESNNIWKQYELKKELPIGYTVSVVDMDKKIKPEYASSIHGITTVTYKKTIPTYIIQAITYVSKEISDNPRGAFQKYILLHEANHAASALITNTRTASLLFAEVCVDYITVLERSIIEDKKLEFINKLISFLHTLIICSENDNKQEILKELFRYCFDKSKGPLNARQNLADVLMIDMTTLQNFEMANKMKNLLDIARKEFNQFDEVFRQYSPFK